MSIKRTSHCPRCAYPWQSCSSGAATAITATPAPAPAQITPPAAATPAPHPADTLFYIDSAGAAHCEVCGAHCPANWLTPPRTAAAAFFQGLLSLARGARVLRGRRRFLRHVILPPILTLLAYLIMIALGLWLLGDLTTSLSSLPWGLFDWARPAAAPGLSGAFILAMAILAYFTFAPVTMAIAGPFLDPVVAEIDHHILGRAPAPSRGIARDLWLAVRSALGMLTLSLGITLLALPLNLIPGVGSLLFLVILALLTGIQALDIPLGRRHLAFRTRLQLVRRNKAATLGLGLGSYLLFLIPILGWLVGPQLSAAGAAWTAHRLRKPANDPRATFSPRRGPA
jgi:CysZ protein